MAPTPPPPRARRQASGRAAARGREGAGGGAARASRAAAGFLKHGSAQIRAPLTTNTKTRNVVFKRIPEIRRRVFDVTNFRCTQRDSLSELRPGWIMPRSSCEGSLRETPRGFTSRFRASERQLEGRKMSRATDAARMR